VQHAKDVMERGTCLGPETETLETKVLRWVVVYVKVDTHRPHGPHWVNAVWDVSGCHGLDEESGSESYEAISKVNLLELPHRAWVAAAVVASPYAVQAGLVRREAAVYLARQCADEEHNWPLV
jgi:hypothetical protein